MVTALHRNMDVLKKQKSIVVESMKGLYKTVNEALGGLLKVFPGKGWVWDSFAGRVGISESFLGVGKGSRYDCFAGFLHHLKA